MIQLTIERLFPREETAVPMNARAASDAEDFRHLPALALALVDHPRATLQELAQAIGISKATLYRFCRTREQLIERLAAHAMQALDRAIDDAHLETGPPAEALRRVIALHLEHRELTAFLTYYWNDAARDLPQEVIDAWDHKLDAFFLRGQQAGVFRIDMTAATLSELWINILIGLVDAERRGRVARAGLAGVVESVFLHGVAPR